MLVQHANEAHERLCCMYYSVSLGRPGLFEESLQEEREQSSNQDAAWINSASFWPSAPLSKGTVRDNTSATPGGQDSIPDYSPA